MSSAPKNLSGRQRWVNLVAKILEETQEKKITWSVRSSADQLHSLGERADLVYETEFMEQRFRIYEYSYQHQTDEFDFEWVQAIKLEFIDFHGRSLFIVPAVEGLDDLFQEIRYQASGIDDFLDKLFD
jgi:hypothetical protein